MGFSLLDAVVMHEGRLDVLCCLLDRDRGEPVYVATLDDHPEWVREAVEEHCGRV